MKVIHIHPNSGALVDDEDFPSLDNYRWHTIKDRSNPNRYAYGWVDKKHVLMHKFIVNELDPNRIVHHINGNTLDNRKSNLEVYSGRRAHNIKHKEDKIVEAGGAVGVHKLCSVCSELKLLKEFSVNSKAPDGKRNMCKPCDVKAIYKSRVSTVTRKYKNLLKELNKKEDLKNA